METPPTPMTPISTNAKEVAGEVAEEVIQGLYVFGLSKTVRQFATDLRGTHLMNDVDWKTTFVNIINNPENKIHFFLDGIDMNPMQMIMDPKRNNFNWELSQLYQNRQAFENTTFHYKGNTYIGFDLFKIIIKE